MEAFSNGDVEECFKAAHTLKGVAANLSFKAVCEAVVPIVEVFRNGSLDVSKEQMDELVKRCKAVTDVISQYC